MHAIRLRGPWTCYAATGGAPMRYHAHDGLPEALRKLAQEFAPDGQNDKPDALDAVSPVLLERPFHQPTGLETAEDIQLQIITNTPAEVILNQQPLGAVNHGLWYRSIRDVIQSRNVLQVRMSFKNPPSTPPIEDVRLVIV